MLIVRDLKVEFDTPTGAVRAVDGLSLTLHPGEMTGLVGESGCGKSTAALAILRLLPQPAGRITAGRALLGDVDLLALPEEELAQYRGRRVAFVFQEPLSALNPVMRVGEQVAEVFRQHRNMSRGDARKETVKLLERLKVRPANERVRSYPHQLSGGMRQRVMLAIALAGGPELIFADEPTTALDPTIQAQIISLLADVCRDTGAAVLLITHDLRLAAGCCGRLAVMREGKIVEAGAVQDLITAPAHPYTAELVQLARGESPAGSPDPTQASEE